jgi:hypothetical protein
MSRSTPWSPSRPGLWLALAMLGSIAAVQLRFLDDPSIVSRYWDGPLYLYVAKTLYQVPLDHPFRAWGHEPSYFAVTFPLYPLLIRACSWVTFGHYPLAMLLATALSSTAAVLLFHELLRRRELVAAPFWTALFFCVLPPRWFVYHSVGASEPLFLCCVFAAFLADREQKPWLVVLCIALASLTRVAGVLLGPVFLLIYAMRREWVAFARVPIAGLGVLLLFGLHQALYGDFFAYFRWQGQHLRALPFELYARIAERPNHYETEFYFWTYCLYGIGTLALWKHRDLFAYSAVYFVFGCFLFINDLARMFVPIAPFALLVGFDDVLRRSAVRWSLPLIACAVLLYAWGIIPHNGVDEASWQKLAAALSP